MKIGEALAGDVHPLDKLVGGVVAAHRIESQGDRIGQGARPIADGTMLDSSRCFHDFPAIIVATGLANMMRLLLFAAIRALDVARRLQRMVGTSHVAA